MELQDLRTKMDAVDDELAELFKERMSLARSIGEIKLANGIEVFNPVRERDILSRVKAITGPELSRYTGIFFGTLFELSRAMQESLKKDKEE